MISALRTTCRPLLCAARPPVPWAILLPAAATNAGYFSQTGTNMKAITFEKPGGLEVLQYGDVDKPTPGQV